MIMNVFGAPEAIKDYKDRVRMQHYVRLLPHPDACTKLSCKAISAMG